MSVDTIANTLSSLKNAALAGKGFVEVPHSRVCEDIVKILKKRGFVTDVKVFKEKGKSYKMIRVDINKADFGGIKRVSKPGHRVYKSAYELKPVAGGFGIAIVSTSRGILSDSEARKKKLGGEVLCEMW